jgi:hypothetical protein
MKLSVEQRPGLLCDKWQPQAQGRNPQLIQGAYAPGIYKTFFKRKKN